MNYLSCIKVIIDNPKNLLKVFEPELERSQTDRSSYNVEELEDGLNFVIKAKDSVSLRATLNSITKLLTVYEKLK